MGIEGGPEHMKNLTEVNMIHAMKALGMSISKIARELGCDRRTVRKYLARGADVPRNKDLPEVHPAFRDSWGLIH